ncbi:hypothetical protein [Diaphorobacter sp.]|uniref:hypothetical protein n=1 Tax=Diaphorobacter sp. TaxID=1934310 RepID=UPI0025884330|nr:hypothetical protein [Diaphorobacter sp.]
MSKKTVMAMLLALAAVHTSASAFNPLEWFMEKQLGDKIKEATIDEMEKATKNLGADFITAKAEKDEKAGGKTATPAAKTAAVPGDKPYLALPLTGPFRFAAPEGVARDKLEQGAKGGYLDRFGNEWVPVRGAGGRLTQWRQHLSFVGCIRLRGSLRANKVYGEQAAILVDLDGAKAAKVDNTHDPKHERVSAVSQAVERLSPSMLRSILDVTKNRAAVGSVVQGHPVAITLGRVIEARWETRA